MRNVKSTLTQKASQTELNALHTGIYGGLFDKTYGLEYLSNSGCVITVTNGGFYGNNQNWKYSDYIDINLSDSDRYLYVSDELGNTSSWGIAFYDKHKVFISGSGIAYNNYNNQQFLIPDKAKYFRFSTNDTTKKTECRIVETIELENSDIAEFIKDITQPLDSFNIYSKTRHKYRYTDTWLNIDGLPFTLAGQVNHNVEYSAVDGFIPVIPGARYRLRFDSDSNVYSSRIRLMLGVISGKSARYLAEHDEVPATRQNSSSNPTPIEDRISGPWGMNFSTAVFSDDYSEGILEFEIPKTLDATDGIFLCWVSYYNFANITDFNLNVEIEEISDYKFPNTKSALSVPYSLCGLSNIIGFDSQAIVYGLGDSTNSDDVSRGITNVYHFSPTKVIASRLKASKYVNYSGPGTTISDMYAKSQLIENDATIVVIITGINDINRQTMPIGDIDAILSYQDPDDIPETTMLGVYCKAVRKLRARLPKNAQIFCVSPFYYISTEIPEAIATFREGLRKMCYMLDSFKGFRFIDGCDVGINPSNWRMLCRDTVHPMMEGQTVIASHIMEHITPPILAGEQYDTVEQSGLSLKQSYQPL